MKKIRTASGGLMFLNEAEYMPRLMAYLRETAGFDAAEAVEEWVKDKTDWFSDELYRAEGARYAAEEKAARVFNEMRDERDEHLREIEELEEELERVTTVKEEAVALNRALVELVENPEKLFPEIGTAVYRFPEKGSDAKERGSIDAYKLRTGANGPEFFVRVSWRKPKMSGYVASPSWVKLANLGKTVFIDYAQPGAV